MQHWLHDYRKMWKWRLPLNVALVGGFVALAMWGQDVQVVLRGFSMWFLGAFGIIATVAYDSHTSCAMYRHDGDPYCIGRM